MKKVLVSDVNIGLGPLVFIAGPCVIESEKSCRFIAQRLKEITTEVKIPFIFKTSYDKANRSSIRSFRGPGLEEGLRVLKELKEDLNIPVLTDVHCVSQVQPVAEVVDVIQVPSFLCRQTDLVVACGQTGKPVNLKKGQFLSPEEMKNVVEKVESTGNENILLTERGTCFGYNNLVVDMPSLVIMRKFGYPVVFDATHSCQLPGARGTSSGGQREFAPYLAKAATAIVIDALYMEVHPNPNEALSDSSVIWPLDKLKGLLLEITALDSLVKKKETGNENFRIEEKLKRIKMLIMDVDGVLTDGRIVLGTDGFETKSFDIKDGHGIKMARNAGFFAVIITGRKSEAVLRRAEELGIEEVYQDVSNKIEVYQKIKEKHNLKDSEIAYIGDDISDIPILERVGLSIAPSDALEKLKEQVDYVTEKRGGRGAVREVTDLLLKKKVIKDE